MTHTPQGGPEGFEFQENHEDKLISAFTEYQRLMAEKRKLWSQMQD